MANEISVKLTVTYTPSATNQVAINIPQFSDTISMTGSDHLSGTQVIGTSAEIIGDATNGFNLNNAGDLASPGWVLIVNLDATNYVEFNSDSGWTNATVRLNAGEFCWFRMGQANAILRGQANTAAVTIQYWVFEA